MLRAAALLTRGSVARADGRRHARHTALTRAAGTGAAAAVGPAARRLRRRARRRAPPPRAAARPRGRAPRRRGREVAVLLGGVDSSVAPSCSRARGGARAAPASGRGPRALISRARCSGPPRRAPISTLSRADGADGAARSRVKSSQAALFPRLRAPRKIWLEDGPRTPGRRRARGGRPGRARGVRVGGADGGSVPLETLAPAEYARDVVAATGDARAGRTPNPDVLCNSRVKFAFVDRVGRDFARPRGPLRAHRAAARPRPRRRRAPAVGRVDARRCCPRRRRAAVAGRVAAEARVRAPRAVAVAAAADPAALLGGGAPTRLLRAADRRKDQVT